MSEKMSIEEYKEKMEELFDECKKVLAQLKGDTLVELKESKKEGKWKPKAAEEYWFRDISGGYDFCHRYEGDGWDDWRVNNIPIFKTEEECERYWHFMDTVKEKSYEFTADEWEDVYIDKYIIVYNSQEKLFKADVYNYAKFVGGIYFKEKNDAQYIIDNFKEELMEYWI